MQPLYKTYLWGINPSRSRIVSTLLFLPRKLSVRIAGSIARNPTESHNESGHRSHQVDQMVLREMDYKSQSRGTYQDCRMIMITGSGIGPAGYRLWPRGETPRSRRRGRLFWASAKGSRNAARHCRRGCSSRPCSRRSCKAPGHRWYAASTSRCCCSAWSPSPRPAQSSPHRWRGDALLPPPSSSSSARISTTDPSGKR